jgi:hypothetical protein
MISVAEIRYRFRFGVRALPVVNRFVLNDEFFDYCFGRDRSLRSLRLDL